MADSRLAPSHWEASLGNNAVPPVGGKPKIIPGIYSATVSYLMTSNAYWHFLHEVTTMNLITRAMSSITSTRGSLALPNPLQCQFAWAYNVDILLNFPSTNYVKMLAEEFDRVPAMEYGIRVVSFRSYGFIYSYDLMYYIKITDYEKMKKDD